jgi:hypothetical protein
MKTDVHISLSSSQNEKCFRHICKQISKKYFSMFDNVFRKSCRLLDNDVTDDITILGVRFACWIRHKKYS